MVDSENVCRSSQCYSGTATKEQVLSVQSSSDYLPDKSDVSYFSDGIPQVKVKVKVKISLLQAMEAHRVARG
jgi:hypothetical protein